MTSDPKRHRFDPLWSLVGRAPAELSGKFRAAVRRSAQLRSRPAEGAAMKTFAAFVAAFAVACSGADHGSSAGTPTGSALTDEDAGAPATAAPGVSPAPHKADDPNATLAERCKDNLRCTISDGKSLEDVTARMRRVAGRCFIETRYDDGDMITHELKANGVTDTSGPWTSDTEHVVLVFGGWLTEDCSLP
jgi:hypothetical protein